MTFSLFDHPHFQALLRHEEIASSFTPMAELDAMLRFEAALARAEADVGVIPAKAASAICLAIEGFSPAPAKLVSGMARDGVIVPALIDDLRERLGEDHGRYLHHGATSQDVIDTGLVLRLKEVFPLFRQDLGALLARLQALKASQGDHPIMARTRMQCALPITFADRLTSWTGPLARYREALDEVARHVAKVQFGGPIGTLHLLADKGPAVRAALATRLDLNDPGGCWHTERDSLIDLGNWLVKLSASLGKIGQDLVLMSQNEVGEAVLASGGRSSAMAHKRNPVQAEILIALARHNGAKQAALQQVQLHEGERSGTAWTLEWLVLPEMVATSAASLKLAAACLDGLVVRSSPA